MDTWYHIGMSYLVIGWDEFYSLSYSLSKKIQKSNTSFDYCIAIARGGLSLAQVLADLLSLPATSCTISSYDGTKKLSSPKMTCDIGVGVKDKNVLLVDDVSDSGETFQVACDYLEKQKVAAFTTASLHIKPKTTFIPDFYMESTDKWIVYPWEQRETISHLSRE